MTTYAVYEITIKGNHHSIFVETGESGQGRMFHVRASVGSNSMSFNSETMYSPGPESMSTFSSKSERGTIPRDKLDHFESVLESVPAPREQYIGGNRNTECQCVPWTEEALDKARSDGVLS